MCMFHRDYPEKYDEQMLFLYLINAYDHTCLFNACVCLIKFLMSGHLLRQEI